METIMDWMTRQSLAMAEKQNARLQEELDWYEEEYPNLEKKYEQAQDMVCFVWGELHSILPHFAERLLDENPELREMME